jgi:hypothetical protein
MVQLDVADQPTIPVCVVAFSECKRVWVWVRLDVDCTVIQESSNRTAMSFILVDYQYQSVELWRSVKTVRCLSRLRLLDIPELQVASPSLHTSSPEV